MKEPAGVVLGTMAVERYNLKFVGQAAHSGALCPEKTYEVHMDMYMCDPNESFR